MLKFFLWKSDSKQQGAEYKAKVSFCRLIYLIITNSTSYGRENIILDCCTAWIIRLNKSNGCLRSLVLAFARQSSLPNKKATKSIKRTLTWYVNHKFRSLCTQRSKRLIRRISPQHLQKVKSSAGTPISKIFGKWFRSPNDSKLFQKLASDP